jgi:hypothetical protein
MTRNESNLAKLRPPTHTQRRYTSLQDMYSITKITALVTTNQMTRTGEHRAQKRNRKSSPEECANAEGWLADSDSRTSLGNKEIGITRSFLKPPFKFENLNF